VLGLFLSRVLTAVAVLVTVTSLVFGLLYLSGDPLAALVPPGASPEQTARLRAHFGLDRPLAVQYGSFLWHAVQGDFGESWRAQRPALTLVLERLPKTLALAGTAILIALLAGVPLGLLAGARPGTSLDALATGFALLGQAVPSFWLGTVLILLFAVRLHWLPASGGDGVGALILPAITLAAYPAATITRLLRSSLIETLSADFIRTAFSKGLSGRAVILRHALPHALLPLLAYVGLQAGFLAGGAVVVEGVFAYPGIGQLALQAVSSRDLPVVQAGVVVVAAWIVSLTMFVDLLARWFDPRLRASGASLSGAGR
jgi:peptide/nickel transport system permease protein